MWNFSSVPFLSVPITNAKQELGKTKEKLLLLYRFVWNFPDDELKVICKRNEKRNEKWQEYQRDVKRFQYWSNK